MNRRHILSLSATIALGLAVLPGSAVSQQKSLKEQVIGTWEILSGALQRPDGSTVLTMGPNSKGLMIFTAEGRFVLVDTRSGRAKFASNNRSEGTAEENQATVRGSIAYFGTYIVNEANKTFTLSIATSTYPNFEGTESTRAVNSITADEFKWGSPAGSAGAPVLITMKRAK